MPLDPVQPDHVRSEAKATPAHGGGRILRLRTKAINGTLQCLDTPGGGACLEVTFEARS